MALGTHTPSLVFTIDAWVGYDRFKLGCGDLSVSACIFQENVFIDIFKETLKSTRNKQKNNGTKIKGRKKGYDD